MAEYIPMRKPGKLTLQEAEEKFKGQHILQKDMVEATGMTTDELDDEAMRSGAGRKRRSRSSTTSSGCSSRVLQ